jgi:hypothetical protein
MSRLKYNVVDKILRKGYPTSSKLYPKAHAEADQKEKKRYPSGYKKMKNIDSKLNQDELSGTHTRKGKITISRKVPSKYRQEVADHEFEELKAEKRLCKHCNKPKKSH